MQEEIYLIIEDGKITDIITKATDLRVIVVNLDVRKKGKEPVIELFETELKKSQLSLN
ncbi:MAG: hypothetical protein IPM56_04375 [Ignavibacteriales bacterium]|nr:MAG: hypothetical protein IPM56_04375 [Ignavibacteriales bacterium]